MGLTLCKKHGRTGFTETCAHVADAIEKGQSGKFHEITILGKMLVCDSCFKSLGLEKFRNLNLKWPREHLEVSDAVLDEYEVAYELIEDRGTYCSKCLAETRVGLTGDGELFE